MAFVRIKWRTGKDGVRRGYRYLVHSKRENGTVKQVNLKYLGALCSSTLHQLPEYEGSQFGSYDDLASEQERLREKLEIQKEITHEVLPQTEQINLKQPRRKITIQA